MEEQQILYKLNTKQTNSYLAIDATGSIAKRIKLPEGQKSSHIFLYQCVCVCGMESIPVFQMTSSKHDAALITYFLLEILRSGAPIPRIAVCDFSKAILIALSRAFARSADLADYLQICYNMLILKLQQCKPCCYIRLDVSHVIAMVARWSCLKGKPPKVRQFFLRSVAHACRMTSFEEVQHLLKSTLVVALSQEIGRREDNTYLDSENHLRYVNTIIKGSATEIEETSNDEETEFQMEEDEDSTTSWTHWTESIIKDAKTIASKSQDGDNVNAFFMPQIIKHFKILLKHIPLWTAVMKPIFATGENTATSSSVEAEFANLKCRAFDGQLPMRVDKFILQHVEYLRGKLILASDKINRMHCEENTHSFVTQDDEITNISSNSVSLPINQEDLKKDDKIIANSHCDSWNETENWRGLHNIKNTDNKSTSSNHLEKPKKATYLDDCPDWDHLKSDVAVGLPLLKNGSICSSVCIDKIHFVIRETCAFDSILQVVMYAFASYCAYKTAVMTIDNPILTLAQE